MLTNALAQATCNANATWWNTALVINSSGKKVPGIVHVLCRGVAICASLHPHVPLLSPRDHVRVRARPSN